MLEQLRDLCYQGQACSRLGHLTDPDTEKQRPLLSGSGAKIAPGHHLSCKMHAVSNQHIITELHSSHQREGQTCHSRYTGKWAFPQFCVLVFALIAFKDNS